MHTSPLAGKSVNASSFCSEWEGERHRNLLRSQHPCRKSHTKIETCGRVFFVSCETTVAMDWSNMRGQAHHFFVGLASSLAGRAIKRDKPFASHFTPDLLASSFSGILTFPLNELWEDDLLSHEGFRAWAIR